MKEEEEGEQLLNTEQCEECVEAEVVNEPKKTTWYTKAKKIVHFTLSSNYTHYACYIVTTMQYVHF